MYQPLNYDKVDAMSTEFVQYARTLCDADRFRLAAQLIGIADAVQQLATITPAVMAVVRMETTLFDDVQSVGDLTEPGYHLHNKLDDLAGDFDDLADIMQEQAAKDTARAAALAKLTKAEKELLGLPV